MTEPEKPIELRPVVRWFAEQMELALRRNDHKGGWHNDTPKSLAERIIGEYAELEEALHKRPSPQAHQRIIAEAADIANMALMVADHSRSGGGPSQDQGKPL